MMMMQDKKLNLFDPLGITVEETNFGCKIYLRRKEKEAISSSHHDDSNNNSRCRDKKFVLHRCILFEDKVALVPITYSIKPGQTHKSLFFCLLKASSRANHHAFMTLYEWREAGKIDVHGLKMFDHQNQSDGDGVFCISLPFSKTVGMAERSDGFSMIQEPLNAESWKHENWKNISCKNCKSVVILEKGPNTQVLNLPSEHWMEFVDCWVCHDDQELFVRHTELKPKSKDQILVGMKEILISSFESFESFESTKSSKSSKSSISILSSSPSLSDNDKIDILSCPKCGLKLGKKFSSHLALEKTGIQINFDDKPQKSITCTPESFVSHQIFNHVMDHSIYRFCINDRLFLRIVNWDLWVNFPGNIDRLNGRALKCLFAFDCPDDSSICDPKVRSSTNMEFIECSNEVVEMLIERLKEFSFLFDSNPSLSYLFL